MQKRAHRNAGNPSIKTMDPADMPIISKAEMATKHFCTFDLGSKRGSGVIEEVNGKTVRVSVVHGNGRSNVSGVTALRISGTGVKRHIIKHNVKVYPVGVIPIN